MSDMLEKSVVQGLKEKLTRELRTVRDPKTGQRPRLKVKGRNLDSLSIEVEGSPDVIEAVNKRLNKLN